MVAGIPAYLLAPARLVAVIAATYILSRAVVRPLVSRLVARRSPPLSRPVARSAHYVTVMAGIVAGLSAAGYGRVLGVVGAVLAAGTFAAGFAMRDTLSAFVSGIFIFVDKPFQIGDWIEWNGTEGKVVDITLRTTKVETFDNEMLTVPNDRITNTTVKNRTARDMLRMTTLFGIGYEDDIGEAKEIVRSAMADIDGVASDPAPTVRVSALADSTVDLKAFYWIRNPKRAKFMRIKEELLNRVKEEFEDAGIDMPYPTQTITGRIGIEEN
ncbi:MAG: mechanosensitive ion channel family protein [Candidatus Nanohaloarchaea archaeon]